MSSYVLYYTTTVFKQAYASTELDLDDLEHHAQQINNDLHSTATAVGGRMSPEEKFIAVSHKVDTAPILTVSYETCAPVSKTVLSMQVVTRTVKIYASVCL